jgi:hypothetical protein
MKKLQKFLEIELSPFNAEQHIKTSRSEPFKI